MEIAEGEASLATTNKWLTLKKENGQKLLSDLENIRNDKLKFQHDFQYQLILKKGIVEIPITGNLLDFKDAVLVKRHDVELINKIIIKGGNRKIKAMKQTMDYRRGIVAMEWEHKHLRMVIADLEDFINDIDNTKVTKDMQTFLKHKYQGVVDKNLSFEEEIELLKEMYQKEIMDNKAKTKDLQQKIDVVKSENKQLDEKIANINIDVCEYQLNRDIELEKQEQDVVKIRMASLLKRARLVKQIQKNHNEILMLQTELELWRLKTYPTLSYKVLN